jgi:hypothetical protein
MNRARYERLARKWHDRTTPDARTDYSEPPISRATES